MKSYVLALQDRILDQARIWVSLAGAVVLVLIQIPWVESVVDGIGLENTAKLRWGILTVLVVAVLLELREVSRRATPDTAGRQHFSDPNDMYEVLRQRAQSISKERQRRLDILGLTLYSAWPQISFWLQRPESEGWTVRFATLSPDADVLRWVPDDWPRESAHITEQIQHAAEGNAKRHVEVYHYDYMPSVHGFRLGNGDVFISNVLWQRDGRLGKRGFSYEYIPHSEAGPAADAYRNLFDNWFARATSKPAPTESRVPVA